MYARFPFCLSLLAIAALVGCQVPAVRSGLPIAHNLPPAQMLLEPGPGVGGPGPGVIPAGAPIGGFSPMGPMGGGFAGGPMGGPDGMMGGPGCAPASGMLGADMGMGYGAPGAGQSVQILFDRPDRMHVQWDVSAVGQFDSTPMVVPGRQNFTQGGRYRLKLTNVPGREGVELYPTLEVAPITQRTASYLAHAAIPVQFTEEDFDQVMAGNFVTKVIYVPDPEFQELALAGIDTLVSTRLDPGVDPVVEADRRGAILAIIRVGNKDLEMPGMDGNFAGAPAAMPGGGVGGVIAPSAYVSGMTGPSYGMPFTGTSIGLPGPPHIPLGGPAGLQRYTLYNHTAHAVPGPTPTVNVHVKQKPGVSYPRPADTVLIREQTIRPVHMNAQPPADMVHGQLPGGCGKCGGLGCSHCR